MNLKDIVDRVKAITDYNPSVTTYDDQIKAMIIDHYLELCSRSKWLFLQQDTTITVYADYTTGTAGVTNGSREVTGSGTSWDSTMEGQTFVHSDVEYKIAEVVSTTRLTLVDAFAGSTAASQSYTIRFDSYILPNDVVDVLYFTSRDDDRGKLPHIDGRTDASYHLDRDQTGDPTVWIGAGMEFIDAPPETITLSAGPSGGSLINGSVYRYKYTVLHRGIESAPSATAEITLSGDSVEIKGLPDMRVQSGALALVAGFRKNVYRSKDGGPFYLLKEIAESSTNYVDDGSASIDKTNILYESGQYQRVRFWPRPSSQKDIDLRYLRRPRELQHDQDVPEMPQEYHIVLRDMTLVDLFQKHHQETSARMYEKRAEERIRQMTQRYTDRTDRFWVMQSGWERQSRRWLPRETPPVKLN